MPAPPTTSLLERMAQRSGNFFRSFRAGPHRTLRVVALGAQLIFGVALLSHPRLAYPFLPTLFGGCTFCPVKAVTSVEYRSNRSGPAAFKVPVCARHAHNAPAKYTPRLQSLENLWLLAPLFLFYAIITLLLVLYGLCMAATLEKCASSLSAWPPLLILIAGGVMSGIVGLHARQMLTVAILGDEFDAARWLFWLALPVTTVAVFFVMVAAEAAASVGGRQPKPAG